MLPIMPQIAGQAQPRSTDMSVGRTDAPKLVTCRSGDLCSTAPATLASNAAGPTQGPLTPQSDNSAAHFVALLQQNQAGPLLPTVVDVERLPEENPANLNVTPPSSPPATLAGQVHAIADGVSLTDLANTDIRANNAGNRTMATSAYQARAADLGVPNSGLAMLNGGQSEPLPAAPPRPWQSALPANAPGRGLTNPVAGLEPREQSGVVIARQQGSLPDAANRPAGAPPTGMRNLEPLAEHQGAHSLQAMAGVEKAAVRPTASREIVNLAADLTATNRSAHGAAAHDVSSNANPLKPGIALASAGQPAEPATAQKPPVQPSPAAPTAPTAAPTTQPSDAPTPNIAPSSRTESGLHTPPPNPAMAPPQDPTRSGVQPSLPPSVPPTAPLQTRPPGQHPFATKASSNNVSAKPMNSADQTPVSQRGQNNMLAQYAEIEVTDNAGGARYDTAAQPKSATGHRPTGDALLFVQESWRDGPQSSRQKSSLELPSTTMVTPSQHLATAEVHATHHKSEEVIAWQAMTADGVGQARALGEVSRPQPVIPITPIAAQIASSARAGLTRFDIRLDPPELGRIDVQLDVGKDGAVTTRLVVERAETFDLLQRDAKALERALNDSGLKTDSGGLQFSMRGEGHGSESRDGNEFAEGRQTTRGEFSTAEEEQGTTTRPPYGRTTGGIDIRV